MLDTLHAWLIRHLGITQCGAFGGYTYSVSPPNESLQRWCRKPFGHIDSCAYDPLEDVPASQPGWRLRARFRGWNV
jgi:hypothetical protein